MELTRSERAKITDSVHSIQSARASLSEIEKDKVPDVEEIQDCLEVFAYYIDVVYMDLKYKPGVIVYKNAWIVR